MSKSQVFKQALKFEKRVRTFLEDLGFEDVSGGVSFKFGNSSQIDACGGSGNILVVVDAHASVEQRRKSIRNKIKAMRGERSLILRGMHRQKRYSKYRDVRLVVAAKGMEFTQADRNFASVHPRVYLWDDQFLNYYSKLGLLTGVAARNDLLGEIDVPISQTLSGDAMTVPAIRTSLRGRTAYLFYARPEALLAISYVARREKGNEQHYQRLIDRSRIDSIGHFLKDRRKRGFFANNVILNFQKSPHFKRLHGTSPSRGLSLGTLHFPREFRAAWIIDGQHRLYGFTKAGKQARDLWLPVIGLDQLTQTKQAELFLEINRNQKAVPPDLIWDLEGEINPNSEYGVISNAVKQLNNVRPFMSTISIPLDGRVQGRHLKLGNICDGILDRHLADEQTETMKARAKNPLYDRNGSRQTIKLYKALRDYFSVCATALHKDWAKRRDGFFCTNNGINVLLRIYERNLAFHARRPTKQELLAQLRVVRKWLNEAHGDARRLEELRQTTSSEGGRADLAEKILSVIGERLELNGFAGGTEGSSNLASKATELERRLAKFFASAMEAQYGSNWLQTRTPADVLKRVLARRGSSTKQVDQFLTLGECLGIALREDNWEDIFKHAFGKVFRGKDGFKVKFEELLSIRNTAVHRPASLSVRDDQLFALYQTDVEECVRNYLRADRPTSSARPKESDV